MKLYEQLRMILDRSGLSKKEVIRRTDIEKSTCYQYFNGKRIPTLDHFNRLVEVLRPGMAEMKTLRETFERTRFGDEAYERRIQVRKFLSLLNNMDLQRPAETETEILSVHTFDADDSILVGSSVIRDRLLDGFLKAMASGRKSTIDLFIPLSANGSYLIDQLGNFYKLFPENHILIRQLISYSSSQKKSDSRILDEMGKFLHMLLVNGIDYSLYYFNDNDLLNSFAGILFPYYVLTENCLFLLDEDFSKCVLLRDSDIINAYREGFEQNLAIAKSVVLKKTDRLAAFGKNTLRGKGKCYMVNAFQRYPELNTFEREHSHMEFLFLSGIEHFVRTGGSGSGEKEEAMTVEQRLVMLEAIRDRLGRDLCVVFDEYAESPCMISLFVSEGGSLIIDPHWDRDLLLGMEEPGIVEAFIDYFEYLPVSEMSFQRETVLKKIDGMEKQLKSRMAKVGLRPHREG